MVSSLQIFLFEYLQCLTNTLGCVRMCLSGKMYNFMFSDWLWGLSENMSRFLALLWTLEDCDPSSALSSRFVGIKAVFPEKLHSGCIRRQRARRNFSRIKQPHMHTPGESYQMKKRSTGFWTNAEHRSGTVTTPLLHSSKRGLFKH